MAIRISGLISGMDTDSLVQELVSAYATKKDNYVKAQTKLEWQMDAWKDLNSKIYKFYTGSLSSMRLSSGYNKKTVTVSDESKAKISGDTNAVNGDQTLEIESLAKTGYLTGGKLSGGIKSTTKLSEITGFQDGTIKVVADGKETSISVTGDLSVAKFVSKLKSAGLNASFDETNQRFFVSAKDSGKDEDFSLTGYDAGGVKVLESLKIMAVTDAEKAQYQATADMTAEDIEKLAANEYLSNAITEANDTYTTKNTELTEKNKQLNSDLAYAKLTAEKKASAYKKAAEKIAEIEAVAEEDRTEEQKTALETNKKLIEQYDRVNSEIGVTITTGTDDEGNTTYTASEVDKTQYDAFVEASKAAVTENSKLIEANNKAVEANSKLLETTYETDAIAGVSFTKFTETAVADGTHNESTTVDAAYASSSEYSDLVTKYENIKSNAASVIAGTSATNSDGAVRIVGSDSKIILNGAEFESNTNNYSINGLTITATGLTEGEEIVVTTSTDVDGVYDMIKGFLSSYNEIIKEMDTLFNAASSKGYEPLTDEEKEAMSESEIEKWEKKIKDSLLRRDSTLGSITDTMKTLMTKQYEVDGETYALSSFGISTLGYFSSGDNEKGVFHIDGDSEDEQTSGNTDKLKAMIASNPDAVVGFFSQLTTGVYNALTKKMSATTLSSAFTLYNDKEMKSRYEDYDDTIDEWEDKLIDLEDKYYDQFAAMESALAQLQSSTTALSSLMGGA